MELLNMSSSAAMLVVMIVIIRALVMNKLPKKTFIVLWGVALYRLLIPFSLPSPFSIYTMEKRIQTAFTEMPSMPRFLYAMMKPSEIAFINENEGVLRTGVTNHWLPISRPIDFPAGRNWVVLVGEQVTGECNITLYH